MAISPSIFLSYARGDDEAFVARVYADLTRRGFRVWWDRVSMPARGLTFLHEIREAINVHDRFLLVAGPQAATSDYVRAEWQHAALFGKAINTVLRGGDFGILPEELKRFHSEDFRDDHSYTFHVENLVRQLLEPIAPLGPLINLPGLPLHLLTRSDRVDELKATLLAEVQRPVVLTGAAAHVDLHGMGGIGKSVLASLVARDVEVRRAFPDGIVWLSFGTRPNLLELQHNLLSAFPDPEPVANVAEGRAKLSEVLASRAVLLILDDVWERAHVEAFDVLGARCRTLITTRDAGLVRSLGGAQHQLELLTESEGLQLLAIAAETDPSQLPSEAKPIVSECGCLPLAVALCAGMLRRGVPWSGVLARLQRAALERIGDRHAADIHHRDIWTAMKVSLDVLAPQEQARFAELSVFPAADRVPEEAVRTLWMHTGGIDDFACEDLLVSLGERSLIRLETLPEPEGGGVRRRISLHDLLHDFASRLSGDPAPLHGRLLSAYRNRLPPAPSEQMQKQWHTVPSDGYIHRRLGWHLERAGDIEGLHALLREETPEGRNAWFEVNERLGEPANFSESVRQALKLTQVTGSDAGLRQTLGRECRYQLITASLNGLRENVPGSLQVALVQDGLWSTQQALACASRARDPLALAALAPWLPPAERNPVFAEALEAVRAVPPEAQRGTALSRLLPHLPQEMLPEALAVARTVVGDGSRVSLIAEVAARSTTPARTAMVDEGMAIARSISDDQRRAYALSCLLPLLPELEFARVRAEVLPVLRAEGSDEIRAMSLAAVAKYFPEPERSALLAEALSSARIAARSYHYGGGSSVFRASALVQVAREIPPELMPQALAAARAINHEGYQSEMLEAMASRLPTPLIPEALSLARTFRDGVTRWRALRALAARLAEPERTAVMAEALRAAEDIPDQEARVEKLTALLPELPSDLLPDFLAIVREVASPLERSELTAKLAARLPEPERAPLLAEALCTARTITWKATRARALTSLATHLSTSERAAVLAEALGPATAIGGNEDRCAALAALAEHLPEPEQNTLVVAAVKLATAMEDPHVRCRSLAALVPHRPAAERPAASVEVLDLAEAVRHPSERADIVKAMTPYLPEEALGRALSTVLGIEGGWAQQSAIVVLAPRLSPDLLKEALEAARRIEHHETRADALGRLAQHLGEEERKPVLREALAAARAVSNEEFRRHALVRLAPQLSSDLLADALSAARAFEDKRYGTDVLVGLSPYWSAKVLPAALEAARAGAKENRARALAALVPHLPEPKRRTALEEALGAARGVAYSPDRVKALDAIGPLLPPDMLPEALTAARTIKDATDRAVAIAALAPRMPDEERAAVLTEALADIRTSRDSKLVDALVALGPHLPAALLPEAAAAARKLAKQEDRWRALATVAPRLPEPERSVALADTLSAAQAHRYYERECAEMVVALAPHLPAALLPEAFRVAFSLKEQSEKSERTAVAALLPRLAGLTGQELAALWSMPLLTAGSRSRLLAGLCRTAPILAALAADRLTIEFLEIAKAIADVSQWWP